MYRCNGICTVVRYPFFSTIPFSIPGTATVYRSGGSFVQGGMTGHGSLPPFIYTVQHLPSTSYILLAMKESVGASRTKNARSKKGFHISLIKDFKQSKVERFEKTLRNNIDIQDIQ